MDEATQERVAANEALLREANEAIERGVWPGDGERAMRFRCECAQVECNQAVELTRGAYEAVRKNPRRFILVDGHERGGAETVVERRRGHIVVEKIGSGGDVAEATNPRRSG
jgi:hypothetical protein